MKRIYQIAIMSASVLTLVACEGFKTNTAGVAATPSTTAAGPSGNNGGDGGSGGVGNPTNSSIRVSNQRMCYAVSPTPAIYTFRGTAPSLQPSDDITWVVAPISTSQPHVANQAKTSPFKLSGVFAKSAFESGRVRFPDLEKKNFNLPITQEQLSSLQAKAQTMPDGVVMLLIYGRTGVYGSSYLSVEDLNSGALNVASTNSSNSSYGFQVATAFIAPLNECLGGDGTPEEREMCENDCDTIGSPLVFDFKGDGVKATSADNGVRFDLNSDGKREQTAWLLNPTSAKTDDAFLVRDLNKNGLIDNGEEMFGQYTKLASGKTAVNGFYALMELDSNKDRVIDSQDNVYKELLVWSDLNGNGISEQDELVDLSEKVKSINLNFRPSDDEDEHGNRILAVSDFVTAEGQKRSVVDIFFQYKD